MFNFVNNNLITKHILSYSFFVFEFWFSIERIDTYLVRDALSRDALVCGVQHVRHSHGGVVRDGLAHDERLVHGGE